MRPQTAYAEERRQIAADGCRHVGTGSGCQILVTPSGNLGAAWRPAALRDFALVVEHEVVQNVGVKVWVSEISAFW